MQCNLCQSNTSSNLPFFYEWDGRRFQAVRCTKCDLVTLDPLPTDAELRRLYDFDYFESGLHGLDQMGTNYEAHADSASASAVQFIRDVIRKRHPRAKSLFEIGAAMGHLLAAASKEGFTCAGVEISEVAVERARKKFGLELHCGNIEDLDPEPWRDQWDIIYAGDLLEHLRDPSRVLAKVERMLAPDGLCIFRIPSTMNLLSTKIAIPLLRLCGREKRLPDNPYHLYEYTTKTAHRMFVQHFQRVEIENTATAPSGLNLKDMSFGYVIKYLLQYLNYPLTRLTGRFGDRLTIYGWGKRA